ncbi:DUF1343 domain-containing protein [Microbacterium lacticum]|uniref:exo-beta-N-acetylmuramidase NamZ family protein n=1 Tax=Microbacterium lacticum TaxID=33885 RepID=UPI0028D4516E|nr:DUF1343 domain-containing protein [Microbacterium lacticum]
MRTGIDVLVSGETPGITRKLREGRIGLVTNNLALTGTLERGRAVLKKLGWRIEVIFAPEHGVTGLAREGAHIADETDTVTGLPVRSLYGDNLAPAPEDLAGLDGVMIDLPDVGARFYTYIWTMSHVLEACAKAHVPVVVLDRPNPIGGSFEAVEGPVLDTACHSFVGRWPIPIRHSLTIGELARHFVRTRGIDVELDVVQLEGWRRSDDSLAGGLTWMPPSPNIPAPTTALLYPGTCLTEGLNLSEGRSTGHPFRVVGAPFLDSERLCDAFDALSLPGVRAVPYGFVPHVRDHVGDYCPAAMLFVTDPLSFRPVHTGVRLISLIEELHPGSLVEHQGVPMPGESHATALEKLFGVTGAFAQITAGEWDDPRRLAVPDWRNTVATDVLYD